MAPTPLPVIRVLYEDPDLIATLKPPGIATCPLTRGRRSLALSLAESLMARYAELKRLPDGGACHRLDHDTGGVVLFARNRPAYEAMREAFSKDRVVREYEAVVEGTLTGDGRVSWPIGPDPKSHRRVRVYKGLRAARRAGALKATTIYRVLRSSSSTTLVRVEIKGGRRHQIRAHFKAMGHPVLHLTATRLAFRHPGTGRSVEIRSEPPPGFSEPTP